MPLVRIAVRRCEQPSISQPNNNTASTNGKIISNIIDKHPIPPTPPAIAPPRHPFAGLKSLSFEPLVNKPKIAPPITQIMIIINQPGIIV